MHTEPDTFILQTENCPVQIDNHAEISDVTSLDGFSESPVKPLIADASLSEA